MTAEESYYRTVSRIAATKPDAFAWLACARKLTELWTPAREEVDRLLFEWFRSKW